MKFCALPKALTQPFSGLAKKVLSSKEQTAFLGCEDEVLVVMTWEQYKLLSERKAVYPYYHYYPYTLTYPWYSGITSSFGQITVGGTTGSVPTYSVRSQLSGDTSTSTDNAMVKPTLTAKYTSSAYDYSSFSTELKKPQAVDTDDVVWRDIP